MSLRSGARPTSTADGVWREDFARALRAEWTMLRTAGETGRLLLIGLVLTAAVGGGSVKAVKCPDAGCGQDAVKLALTGVTVGQAVIAVFAVLAVSGEYATGMIRTTLIAVPNRTPVLTVKATILTAVVLASGTAAVLASLLAGRHILPGNGSTEAHGYAPLSPADGPTLRAAVGSVLYLVLIALLGLGVATGVRDAASAVGIVLGLLYLFPTVARVVGDPEWQRHLHQISPMTAGPAIQGTARLHGLPIGAWASLGVVAAWAAAALLVGGLVLHRRDA
ncbi:ABC transporter permease subunit [Streptomyces asoensis]|uniref:ABC transporter permease n=1 Tax=Streptomyces asoensis TaxID=249586 RepID=A0ABQ3RYC9_9ACTN|nr:ABC transporter permease subunit [Streptomyces asoensis]GGQ55212.1 ABC transporter permease [Streptomyces asoensis]GHI60875.1 ABC transporter permease [Streptomyces asoensis]